MTADPELAAHGAAAALARRGPALPPQHGRHHRAPRRAAGRAAAREAAPARGLERRPAARRRRAPRRPRRHEPRAAVAGVARSGDHVYHLFVARTRAPRGAARVPRRAGHRHRGALPDPDPPDGRVRRASASAPGSLPVAERLAEQICTLPLFPPMSDDEIARVIDAVQDFDTGGVMTARKQPSGRRFAPAELEQRAPLRIAVVGYGYWGPNLVRNVIERPELELAALCERDDARAAAFTQRVPERAGVLGPRRRARRPDDRRRARRHAAAHAPRARPAPRCTPASTCWSRSRWRGRPPRRPTSIDARRRAAGSCSCRGTRSSTARRSTRSAS